MQSKAATVTEYVASLPPDRREAIEKLRQVFRANLPKGVEEGMLYGMIGYYIPHAIYPPGYHCDPKLPLCMAGLASQKQHLSMYILAAYGDFPSNDPFRKEWLATGKKLDMGKCCIRFKTLDAVPLDVVARALKRLTIEGYINGYESVLESLGRPHPGKKKLAGAGAAKVVRRTTPKAAKKAPLKATKKAVKKRSKGVAVRKPAR